MPDYIVINDDLRTMQIPSSITLLGVESDDDVNKIPFQMPKEYCGFDLSTFEARINYMNAAGGGDVYIVDDLAVDGDDPSLMTFTWLVGRNACAYKGLVKFIVCLKKFDEDANVVQEFNTTVYSLPVLEGLETTEAVVQQNADIIEYILKLLNEAGVVDMENYYTKAETNALIPSKLPNPEKLTINGTEYDGSEAVDLTIEASSEVLATASGVFIHVTDAVPQRAKSFKVYDSNNDEIAETEVCMANKNLFRIDALAAQTTSKGITFVKNADGSISVNGTSTGTYAMTAVGLSNFMFEVGRTYTLSSGKTSGLVYVQLIINYTDNTTDYIVARNSSRTFKITKAVASCTGSVQITDQGVTVNNEIVWPMLEVGDSASKFVNNFWDRMTFDGSVMPVLPAAISNIYPDAYSVANMVMEYEADTVESKIDEYVNTNLIAVKNPEIVEATTDDISNIVVYPVTIDGDQQTQYVLEASLNVYDALCELTMTFRTGLQDKVVDAGTTIMDMKLPAKYVPKTWFKFIANCGPIPIEITIDDYGNVIGRPLGEMNLNTEFRFHTMYVLKN